MFQPATLGDPNAYRAIFFEETQDHLAQVESILLALQPAQHSPDQLNAIFRAVHSIKGSAAMLGCEDMAQLAHLQENLLDVLRKQERPLERGDVDALLQSCDALQAQALRHRGVTGAPPDTTRAEALLREQLARPRRGAVDGASGPVTRRFRVAVGPLAEPIDAGELETMLTGLAEMGRVSGQEVDNRAGGRIAFEVALEGTDMDLRSVLALLVPPEIIAIEEAGAAAPAPAPAPATGTTLTVGAHDADEFFEDPEALRRRRAARRAAAEAEAGAFPPAPAPAPAPAPEAPPAVAVAAPRAAEADPAADLPLSVTAHDTGYIRVATEKIDLLVNLVGELVITEAMLTRPGVLEQAGPAARLLESGLADLTRHTRNLQEAVMAIRMLPISNVFTRFARIVHELAGRLGKRVELKLSGETTELDRGLIEKISDPLNHLVRNAVDHGIEPPEVRRAAGKPEAGQLRLRASQRGGSIVIQVSDDGRGLDRERILRRARERGIPVADDAPDREVWSLIFEPGFSTADTVTEVSGRGVGMDVVRRNIQALGGTIELDSAPGEGTTFTVSVPLTLAIMEAMIVSIGGEIYVLPLSAVVESLSVEPGIIHSLPGQGDTLRLREDFLPVLHLARLFPPQQGVGEPGSIAVIVEADGQRAALVVDELVGQQQVVVKSLEANFRKVPGLSGATVMGDGSVALILDVSHLVRMSGRAGSLRL